MTPDEYRQATLAISRPGVDPLSARLLNALVEQQADALAMARALQHYKAWFGDDCMCFGEDGECALDDGFDAARRVLAAREATDG